jgi:hypothetical protein
MGVPALCDEVPALCDEIPALCDESVNVIIAAGVCIVVCIHLFDVLGEFIISERRWRWSVAESSVENKKARVSSGEDRSNVCIHSGYMCSVLVGHFNVVLVGHCIVVHSMDSRGDLHRIGCETTVNISKDLGNCEGGCSWSRLWDCYIDGLGLLVIIVVIMWIIHDHAVMV